ncbi:hypothetical protein E1189_04515 [Sansalvadorimonas verongulae]|nr:hypothetical protein [Sansalvadorimonas verongulae]
MGGVKGLYSTVEATVALLAEVKHSPESCQQMLNTFERMVQLQIEAMGKDIWSANYGLLNRLLGSVEVL